MSHELVPVSHDRAAWNAIHSGEPDSGELRDHNDALTPEQAAAINKQFDIQVYLGAHMFSAEESRKRGQDLTPEEAGYAEAESLIDSMKQGDTLFVEGYGFKKPVDEPVKAFELETPKIETFDDPYKTMMSGMVALAAEIYKRQDLETVNDYRQKYGAWLQGLRQNRQIDAFDYAAGLAHLKGIRVVKADIDAAELQAWNGSGYEDGRGETINEVGDDGQTFAGRANGRREMAARNIVKDWAVDHLVEDFEVASEDDRSKLVLLFGAFHGKGLETAFADSKIDAQFNILNVSMRELGKRLSRLAMGMAVSGIASEESERRTSNNHGFDQLRARRLSTQKDRRKRQAGSGLSRFGSKRFGNARVDKKDLSSGQPPETSDDDVPDDSEQ